MMAQPLNFIFKGPVNSVSRLFVFFFDERPVNLCRFSSRQAECLIWSTQVLKGDPKHK